MDFPLRVFTFALGFHDSGYNTCGRGFLSDEDDDDVRNR